MRTDGVELNPSSFRSILQACVVDMDYKAATATLLEAHARDIFAPEELSKLKTRTMSRLGNQAAHVAAPADSRSSAGRKAAIATAQKFYAELDAAG
eukprot:SAG31_NODE_21048_length_559_cov_0.671739_1_plen_95_part_10